MARTFYIPGKKGAGGVHELFDAIAHRYDLINDLQSFGLHRRWKRRLVREAEPRPGVAALDVCCGTGDIALALARRGARVVGLDFNERMLEVARRKAEGVALGSAGHPLSLEFVKGDALQLPFPDASFDIVTVGYGLRNLPAWDHGLAEMVRVSRPGARLLVLDFGKPDNTLWRTLYFAYLRLFVPILGRIFCGNAAAYAYILESLHRYPAQRGVEARMTELGLKEVRVINLLGGIMSINVGRKGMSAPGLKSSLPTQSRSDQYSA